MKRTHLGPRALAPLAATRRLLRLRGPRILSGRRRRSGHASEHVPPTGARRAVASQRLPCIIIIISSQRMPLCKESGEREKTDNSRGLLRVRRGRPGLLRRTRRGSSQLRWPCAIRVPGSTLASRVEVPHSWATPPAKTTTTRRSRLRRCRRTGE